MYDAGKIITGLIIGLAFLVFPIWYNLGTAMPPAPDPKLTPKAKEAKECIRPKADMKTSHMQILDDWRNAVVRDTQRYYVPVKEKADRPELTVITTARNLIGNVLVEVPGFGEFRSSVDKPDQRFHTGGAKQVEMSLQNTCMDCHSNKKDFCDQCHNYTNVNPFCWDCHLQPEEKK